MTSLQHEITKTNLHETQWVDQSLPALADGAVRLRLDAFALTANNVTYAAFGGPPMHYWNFFPAMDESHGRVPVWGFATVAASNIDGINPGQRFYGYYPIAQHLDVTPVRVSPGGFMDGAAHRQGLAPIYNTYVSTEHDPSYDGDHEAQQMLFRPLYLTGWMICDSLVQGTPKPDTVIISSASSKTALATAHNLKSNGIHTVGLTSPGNKAFVETSSLYDETCVYDELADLNVTGNAAYVDFIGRPDISLRVHTQLGNNLKRSMIIGATDWSADRTPTAPLPGPVPEFFFVPDYAAERAKTMQPGELERTMVKDLRAFYPVSKNFVTPEEVVGTDAIDKAWQATLDGNISPTRGLICSF